MRPLGVLLAFSAFALHAQTPRTESIPLAEHPRPDFERAEWLNLNGRWRFAFDARNDGARAGWTSGGLPGGREILVPFSWGAPLSGVPDSADVGWYARSVTIPDAWRGRRVFLVFGASDWRTSAWLDGQRIGEHQGGYTPFSFELTSHARLGQEQRLVVRVDDTDHPFKLEGKQGYGKARGMWQTVYLEARGSSPLAAVRYTPKDDLSGVAVDARLLEPAPRDLVLELTFTNRANQPVITRRIARGATTAHVDVPLPNARRWSLEDPFLHEVTVSVGGGASGVVEDVVRTYFGMRTISVVDLPRTTHRYVAINGTPVYLQLALDQAYHPEGYYTFPTDSVLRNEILLARQIGLNGLREHIKIESPRKLYWADRLGVLIMADVPNWWGPPDSTAFREHELALRGMIDRDYNHPSVFSWVLFNETWGLHTKVENRDRYLAETQRRVVSVYRLAKSLDSTRLVEDNSPCCRRGHTETDINSWHEYLPGWRWEAHVQSLSDSTFPGSTWNFESPWRQARQPMLNSEFGNVWGYEGSTGDVDWSWDYRRAVDAFRRHPKLAGWLYTEHHDVINEWNGYWRFDRSWKETGLGELVEGMTLRDLHSPLYVAVGDSELSRTVRPGERVNVPLYASFLSGSGSGDSLTLRAELHGWNTLGERRSYGTSVTRVPYRPWMSRPLPPLPVTMPSEPAVVVLAVRLEDAAGTVLHRNFTTFVVEGDAPATGVLVDGSRVRVSRVPATAVRDARWSLKQWTVLGDRKLNGAGSGFVEYRIPWPAGLDARDVAAATFLVEASAKRLNGKDRDTTAKAAGDYMRGGGFHDRSRNPNSYPMTSETKFPSAVTVRINGYVAGRRQLDDDPADSRGILSWHAQPRDRRLHEAGSYGQLLRVPLPAEVIAHAAQADEVVVRLEVDEALPGGLAIYGARFGRYPVDPTVLFVLRAQDLHLEGLRTEYQQNPVGIDVRAPRLSWRIHAVRRGTMQSAYQIRVAADSVSLQRAPLWDSGKVPSAASILRPYGGPALRSGTRYYWQVRVWDDSARASPWSAPAFWEMGLLDRADWTARWITPDVSEDSTRANPSPMLRREFTLSPRIASARLYVTSLGLNAVELNGQRVSDRLFSPGWTSYDKRLQYDSYDVTALVRSGANALGATLGDGWYRGRLGFEGKRNTYGTRLGLLAQLVVRYADGRTQVVGTDEQWKASTGPILLSDIYDGETYDARLETPGWSRAGYDSRAWRGVRQLDGVAAALVAPMGPPVRRMQELKPSRILRTPSGETVFDVGQNMVGWVRLKVSGPAGTTVRLRHAEVLDKAGNFYTENLRDAAQTVQYTLKGGGVEIYEPHFTFQGFRYVAVEGFPGTPTLDAITGIAVYSDLTPTGTFETSNALVNQLQQNIVWGQRGNFLDIPTDCPQRDERLGWTGDAQVFARTAAFNMDVSGFFAKWLTDLAADQKPNGAVPWVIPDAVGRVTPGRAASAGWADAAVIVPWDMYQAYGDTAVLTRQYSSMRAWVEYMRAQAGDSLLWNKGFHFGDWLAFQTIRADYPGATTDKDLIATAYFAHSSDLLARAAEVLGKGEDARSYRALFENIRAAFQREYITATGRLTSNTQTAYVLALDFDLLSDSLRAAAARRLAEDVRRMGHLTTGFLGTPALTRMLSENGYLEDAYKLLLNERYPSWLYEVKQGATTVWERWDGQKPDGTFQETSMNSFNHYAYGAIGDWMYRVVAGLNDDPAQPGYKHIVVRPQPGGGFTHAMATLLTPYGEAASGWKLDGDVLRVTARIPANTRATVHLPGARLEQVREGNAALTSTPGITRAIQSGETVLVQVGSGNYEFAYEAPALAARLRGGARR